LRKSTSTSVWIVSASGALAGLLLLLALQFQRLSQQSDSPRRSSEPILARPVLEAGRAGQSPLSPQPAPPLVAPAAERFSTRVTGLVVEGLTDRPVPGGTVLLLGDFPGVEMSPMTVGENGMFQGEIVSSSTTDVWLYYRDGDIRASGAQRLDLSPARAAAKLRLSASATYACRVAVRTQDGRPASGASIEAKGSVFAIRSTVDSTGVAHVRVPMGTLGFWARGIDGSRAVSDAALELPPPHEPIEHVLVLGEPWTRIPLQVAAEAGSPLLTQIARVSLSRLGQRDEVNVTVGGPPVDVEVPANVCCGENR
jgi:hypothetical protein